MTIPDALAPRGIKSGAKKQTPLARCFPYECSALRHTELTTLKLPGNAQVARIPSNVQFQSGPLSDSEPLSGGGCGKLKNPATTMPS